MKKLPASASSVILSACLSVSLLWEEEGPEGGMKRPFRIDSNRASFRAIRSFCSELKRERRARRLVGEVGDCEVGELLDLLALLGDEADASSAPIPLRQIGQVLWALSQALAQDSWNQ